MSPPKSAPKQDHADRMAMLGAESSSEERNEMARTYIVTLTAGEDGYIVAECPALPGCVSQGFTREEALKKYSRGDRRNS